MRRNKDRDRKPPVAVTIVDQPVRRDPPRRVVDRRPIVDRSRTAPPRDKMRVAQAQRIAAADIPDVVLAGTVDKRPSRVVVSDPVPPRRKASAPRAGHLDNAPKAAPLSLDKPKTCHKRPTNTKGDGSSRPFAGRYCNRG